MHFVVDANCSVNSHKQGARRAQRAGSISDAHVCSDKNERLLDDCDERQHSGARCRVIHQVSRFHSRQKSANHRLLESRTSIRRNEIGAGIHPHDTFVLNEQAIPTRVLRSAQSSRVGRA